MSAKQTRAEATSGSQEERSPMIGLIQLLRKDKELYETK